MWQQLSITAAALNLFVAVSAGAFGAHALKARLAAEQLAIWQTAVTYHMTHGLGLLLLALLGLTSSTLYTPALKWGACLMQIGIVLFSGSLYLLVLSNTKWLGAITPIGGLAFLSAWLMLAYAALKKA